MTTLARSLAALLSLLPATVAYEFGSEVISDITAPMADEGRALKIKDEDFWNPVLQAAQRASDAGTHDEVYAAADAAIAELGPEHSYVREALQEAVTKLQQAKAAVRAKAAEQAQVASEQLMAAPSGWDWSETFSFLSGGRWGDALRFAIRSFVDGGRYGDRLQRDIYKRREEALPALRGASAVAGNVLADCRKATARAFDVLKYDIYTRGVPKTPKAAKEAAEKLVAASGETRSQFLGLVKEVAVGITKDVQAQNDRPSATVTRALFEDSEALPPVKGLWGGRVSASKGFAARADMIVAL